MGKLYGVLVDGFPALNLTLDPLLGILITILSNSQLSASQIGRHSLSGHGVLAHDDLWYCDIDIWG